MQRPPKNKLVWVTWYDAVGDSSRATIEELSSIALAKNCNLGWIIHEDATRIVLAHGFSDTGEIDHFTIPRGNIDGIEPVAARAVRKPKLPTETK